MVETKYLMRHSLGRRCWFLHDSILWCDLGSDAEAKSLMFQIHHGAGVLKESYIRIQNVLTSIRKRERDISREPGLNFCLLKSTNGEKSGETCEVSFMPISSYIAC